MAQESVVLRRANEALMEIIDAIFQPSRQDEEPYLLINEIMSTASKMLEKSRNPKYNEYTYTALTNAISEIFSILNKNKQIHDLDQITISNIEMIVSSLFHIVKSGKKSRWKKDNIFAITDRIFSNIRIDDPKAKNELKIINNSYSYVTHSVEDETGIISEERFSGSDELNFDSLFTFIDDSDENLENSDSQVIAFLNVMPQIFPDYHKLYNQAILDSFLYAYFVIHTLIFFKNRLRFIEEKGLDKRKVLLDLQKTIAKKILYFYDTKLAELDGNYAKASVWLRNVFSLSTYAPHEARSKQANIRVTARQFFNSLGVHKASSTQRTIEGKILISRVKALEAKIIYHIPRTTEFESCEAGNSMYDLFEEIYRKKVGQKEIESNISFVSNNKSFSNIFYRIASHIMPYFKGRMDTIWEHIINKVDCPSFLEAIAFMDLNIRCIYAISIIYAVPALQKFQDQIKNLPDLLTTFMCNKLIKKNQQNKN